jgi:hypothetical protein
MEVSGQLHTLAALPRGGTLPQAAWDPQPAWTLRKREISLGSAGNRTRFLDRSALDIFAIYTEVSRPQIISCIKPELRHFNNVC